MTETTPSPLGNVITIDDERVKNHLDRVVRGSVEETLNAPLDAEVDQIRGRQPLPICAKDSLRHRMAKAACCRMSGHRWQ
jgi:hypothetical protein